MTIGELPSSYIESLSYYECLVWLCNYLENTVVPVVNNNSEVVKELQEYVKNYFNNLNVQTEINNKLDEMVADGTLAKIINQDIFNELNTNVTNLQNDIITRIKEFNTVSDLKNNENLVNNEYVVTKGYYNINDQGGAKDYLP